MMRARQSGFSLLEAIVAMVIFSMVAMALYAWQGTNLTSINRAEVHARNNQLVRSALGVLHGVNPMRTPRGERPLGTMQVRWTSTLVQPARNGVSQVGLPSLFSLGLYDMHVQVIANDKVRVQFHVRQVGYQQVRHQNTQGP
jgi:general secretion pathway protein I